MSFIISILIERHACQKVLMRLGEGAACPEDPTAQYWRVNEEMRSAVFGRRVLICLACSV
jgi:hypothetical protein